MSYLARADEERQRIKDVEMGETRFTPGPWSKDKYGQLRSPTGQQVEVWDAGIAWVNRNANAEANAALIAAAPTMYDRHESTIGDLVLLKMAIEHGDPVSELIFRIDDMLENIGHAISQAHVSPQAVSENGNVQGVK